MLPILLLTVIISPMDSIYQSKTKFSSTGLEYQPKNNNVQLLSTKSIQTKMLCSVQCNQLFSCRIFDYDSVSKRCRLFEGDSTTGSIISSSSSTSVVGTIEISSNLYSSVYNQPCQSCQQDRYEVCSNTTNRYQCPDHTYWNGVVCALQLFENQTCGMFGSCRSDLNLTCLPSDCYGYSNSQCVSSSSSGTTNASSTPFGITVAGGCNGSASTNQTQLNNEAKIILGYNNTMYVVDKSFRLLFFDLNTRAGSVLRTFNNYPLFVALDSSTSNIYIGILLMNLIYIWPTNATFPSNGISYTNCSMNWVYGPTGIIVDSVGNVYMSSYYCNWVVKWTPYATSTTLVAGSSTGAPGTDNRSLYKPYGLALDEPNSFIYVTDRYNHRIQRFILGGTGVGVTVAGDRNPSAAANELYIPTDIYLSKIDGSLYICDNGNNRIQKWTPNATSGITVAGSPTGISGNTSYLLNGPYGIAIDDGENYLYVSDSQNNRVQRFSLH